MAGVEEAVTCPVCSEVYKIRIREPLVVPCGHVFCRNCLKNIRGLGNLTCPSCRKRFICLDIQELPICFPLLSLGSTFNKIQRIKTCSEHEDVLKYWCRGCELPLCGLCLYCNHPRGHDVQPASTCIEEKKQALQKQVKILNMTLKQKKEGLKKKIMHTVAKIKLICQESSHLHDIEMELAALSKEMQEARNIEGVLVSEARVKSLQEQLPKLLSKDNVAADNVTKEQCLAASDKTAVKDSASSVACQQQLPPGGRQTVNTCWARLNCQDGRLLLHTPSSRTDSLLFMKLPTEAFLQVSIRDRCLGRVYIRLWCQLRRAQHFQAICNGTLGLNYVGASFTISSQGQEKEALDVRKYVLPNGDKSNKVLMTDLEWGGRFTGPANEGVVMGSSHGADTHGFGICTRGQPGGTFKCPFGEVSSGMDIVKEAINHEPITEVTITGCGLVIPEIFQP